MGVGAWEGGCLLSLRRLPLLSSLSLSPSLLAYLASPLQEHENARRIKGRVIGQRAARCSVPPPPAACTTRANSDLKGQSLDCPVLPSISLGLRFPRTERKTRRSQKEIRPLLTAPPPAPTLNLWPSAGRRRGGGGEAGAPRLRLCARVRSRRGKNLRASDY